MNNKFKLTDKVTKESIRSPEFKRWLKVVLAAVCIFSLIFQFSTCVFTGLNVYAANVYPGDTIEIEILPSLPTVSIIDMDAVFESNGNTYYGIKIDSLGISYYSSLDIPVRVYSDLSWSDQSFRTITISIMSPNVFSWIDDNSIVIDSSIILNAGTYKFNDIPFLAAYGNIPLTSNLSFTVTSSQGFIAYCDSITLTDFNVSYNVIDTEPIIDGVTLPTEFPAYVIDETSVGTGWELPYFGSSGQYITITQDTEVIRAFGYWFITNSNYNEVNSPPIGYDFINEIRQFNEELTLYVTDSAEWSESFSFEFDVMGFGYSDTLYLQRGLGVNSYFMSYNFDIDGVFTPWRVYRYSYSTQSGGFLYQNARLIRFITNPDDIEFQQWLLDNTTLVATVDDASSFDQFYETGYDVGYNAGYEQGFANSLIGDSLSGPINALSSITLIQIGDVEITLGGVVMTAIALCLVLAFLKLYAGG